MPWRWPPDMLATRRAGVLDADAEVAERLLAAPAHRGLVEEAELAEQAAAQDLAAEEHVRGGVDLGREREVLVDGLDPELARLRAACGSSTGLPSKRISPLSGGCTPTSVLTSVPCRRRCRRRARRPPGVDGEVRAAQRLHAAERLDDLAGLEQRLGLTRSPPRSGRAGGSGCPRRPPSVCRRRRTGPARCSRARTGTLADRALAAGHEHDREALVEGVAGLDRARRGSRRRPPSAAGRAGRLGQRGGVDRLAVERLERGLPAELEVLGAVVDAELLPLDEHREVGRLLQLEQQDAAADRVQRAGGDEDRRRRPGRGPRGGLRASRRRPARRPSGGRSRRRAAP